MKTLQSSHRINNIAKQLGFGLGLWLVINSMSYDRTPEITQGSREGAGYA
jgi:hypothetical protein